MFCEPTHWLAPQLCSDRLEEDLGELAPLAAPLVELASPLAPLQENLEELAPPPAPLNWELTPPHPPETQLPAPPDGLTLGWSFFSCQLSSSPQPLLFVP